MLQQSGCFRVVDRNLGLKGTKQELDLQESGLTRKDSTVNPRGNVLEAQSVLTPTLVFSEQNASGGLEGILDSVNKLVPHVRELAANSMPDRVATKKP